MANYNLTQTGAQVQAILNTVAAGYIYMGVADLTTTPDTTNPNVCYILKTVGTYTNFGNIQHTSGIGIALWNGTAWSYQNVPSAAVVATDATPTANSTNPVQSGGVYEKFEFEDRYVTFYSRAAAPTGSLPMAGSGNINTPLGSLMLVVGKTYYLTFDLSAQKTFDITLRAADGSSATISQTIAASKTYSAGTHIVKFIYSAGTYLRFGTSAVWSALSNITINSSRNELGSDRLEICSQISDIINAPTDVDFMDFGGNYFDKNSSEIENGYVSVANGTIVSDSSYKASGFIHLKANTNYTTIGYSSLYGSTNFKKVACYDKDKVYIGNAVGVANGDKITFSIPNSIYYVRITIKNADLDTFMLVEGSTYPTEYKSHIWTPNRKFNTTALDADFLLKLQAANPLYGKLIAYDGDSIARGADDTSPYGWSSIIAEKNNGTYISRAAGGGTITDGLTTSQGVARHCICTGIEAIANNNENPDYIIFEGGTNDADVIGSILDQNNLPEKFGTWNINGYTGPFDKETFCGAVEYMFQKALTLFPHAKFGFIIAQKMGRSSHYSETDTNIRAYFGVIMDICKKWGIPYINLWDEGFLCPSINSHYNPDLDREGNIEAHSLYIDGQHLTLEGYQSLSSKIDAWIKTL